MGLLPNIVVCLTSLLIADHASATVDAAVRDALVLHAAGKPADAFAKLAPLERARAGDPDYDYALGLAAADSGHRGRAIVALQRILAVQPGNGPARAEIARVYALSGDIDTARAQFDTVVNDPSVPDPVRQRLDRLVRGFDHQINGGGRDISGFVDGEVGYDSNINTATGLTSVTLPVFAFLGPAALTGSATQTSDGYGQAQAGLSASTTLSRQTKLYGSLLASTRNNFGGTAFDQDSVTPTVGLSYTTAARDTLALSTQAQFFWLGHHAYRTSYGAIGQYTHRLEGGRAVFFSGQYFRLDYQQDRLRSANRFAGSVGYAGKYIIASVSGGREALVRAAAGHLAYGFASIAASAEVPVSRKVAVLASGSVEYRGYDDTDPLFLRNRHDTQIDTSIGLRIALAKGISARPRVTYTRNFSPISLYDYARTTAALGLRAEF
jgi:tetratricopeptide (TPR) repeat protein